MMIKWLTVNWFDSSSLGLMLVVNSKLVCGYDPVEKNSMNQPVMPKYWEKNRWLPISCLKMKANWLTGWGIMLVNSQLVL